MKKTPRLKIWLWMESETQELHCKVFGGKVLKVRVKRNRVTVKILGALSCSQENRAFQNPIPTLRFLKKTAKLVRFHI